MAQISAGLLVFRRRSQGLEVFVVHPGGPLFAKKDAGAWSLPKGLLAADEDPVTCARREFAEETGQPSPAGSVLDLGEVRLKSGKRVMGFAIEGDVDADRVVSNSFGMEWPPRSGQRQSFPEVDRGAWFTPEEARTKLNAAQSAFVDRLIERLAEVAVTA